MSPHERSIGFVVEHEKDDSSHGERLRLVVIDKRENERFVRNIFEAFADPDKKLEGTRPKLVERTGAERP